jgi:glycine cleavage system aminomethyltransferase T
VSEDLREKDVDMAPATARVSFDPVRRSPAQRRHVDLGARLGREAGWDVVADYGTPAEERDALASTIGLADVTARGKVDLRGRIEPLLAGLTDGDVGSGATEKLRGDAGLVARPEPRSALLLGSPGGEAELLRALEPVDGWNEAMVTDVTSLFAGFVLGGPRAFDLLTRITGFDLGRLTPGTAAWLRLAGIRALLVHPAGVPGLLEAYVGSEYGRYAWDTLLGAGRGLGALPIGWNALAATGWR